MHHTELSVGLMIDVEMEPHQVFVEAPGAIDIADWEKHQLELEVQQSLLRPDRRS
jgi:hypothetical protein